MAEQRFYESHFSFDIGLRIYAKFYTIEELVALSVMPTRKIWILRKMTNTIHPPNGDKSEGKKRNVNKKWKSL